MPYLKQEFVDREVDDLGKVIEEGTTLKAQHLNHIEDAVYVLANIFDQLNNVLPSLMENATFKNDQTENLNELRKILADGVKYYNVAYNLTNLSVSNTVSKLTIGTNFYTKILVPDNYILDVDTIQITMGDEDITKSAYTEDGSIRISEVTGNISITALANIDIIYTQPAVITAIDNGTATWIEGSGLSIERTAEKTTEAIIIPTGQYLQKKTLYTFSLQDLAKTCFYQVLICSVNEPGQNYNIEDETSITITDAKLKKKTDWINTDLEYMPLENNEIFVMVLKVADGSEIGEKVIADMLSKVKITST